MTEGPPFERYPGPLRRDGASFRVISPWRDALAWVSVAGPLAVTRFLVREEGIWRDALAGAPEEQEAEGSLWVLEQRDPVELVFRTMPGGGVNAVASVSVTREACEIRVEPAHVRTLLREIIFVPARASISNEGDTLRISLQAG